MRNIRKATTKNGGERYAYAETYGRYPIIEEPSRLPAKPKEKRHMSISGEAVAGVGAFAAILFVGGFVGHELGVYTDEMAHGRIRTAQECLATVPHQDVITQRLDACMEKGVPDGDPIGANKISVGDPVPSVNSYIAAEKQTVAGVEYNYTFQGAVETGLGVIIIGACLGATVIK